MRGRLPIHQGNGYALAETGGAEEVTLTTSQIPSHTHTMLGSSDVASVRAVTGGVYGRGPAEIYTGDYNAPQALSSQSVSVVGGSQPHTNFQPYLCVNYIISLFGIFPSQT
jgi:microcystin-dependent protein